MRRRFVLLSLLIVPSCSHRVTSCERDEVYYSDFRGSDTGFLDGANVEEALRDLDPAAVKSWHGHSNRFRVTEVGGSIRVADLRHPGTDRQLTLLPSWKMGAVTKVTWPEGCLYFEQEKDCGHRVAHCLVDLETWRFVYVRVH